MLVFLDHCENASEKNEENIKEVNEDFISKGNLSCWKKLGGKSCRKIALNGQMSIIENILENLGSNLKTFKICVLFWNKKKP